MAPNVLNGARLDGQRQQGYIPRLSLLGQVSRRAYQPRGPQLYGWQSEGEVTLVGINWFVPHLKRNIWNSERALLK